ISGRYLLSCYKIRNWINEKAFDCALQMTGAVLEVYTLVEQEFLRIICALENEFLARASHDPVLHVPQLGRELAFGGLGCRAIDLLIDVVLEHSLAARRRKADRPGD